MMRILQSTSWSIHFHWEFWLRWRFGIYFFLELVPVYSLGALCWFVWGDLVWTGTWVTGALKLYCRPSIFMGQYHPNTITSASILHLHLHHPCHHLHNMLGIWGRAFFSWYSIGNESVMDSVIFHISAENDPLSSNHPKPTRSSKNIKIVVCSHKTNFSAFVQL